MSSHVGKLIRDGVPAMIEAHGENAVTRALSGREYAGALRTRVQDGVRAYIARPTPESLAELYELLELLRDLQGLTPQQLEEARQQLTQAQGDYSQRLVLERVEREPVAVPQPPSEQPDLPHQRPANS